MEKRNIYMVQPSSEHTDVMPLPYAIGVLHAYVCSNEEIMNGFSFAEYIFEKKDIAQTALQMQEPFAVFFSSYIWNYEYNRMLAREIRRRHPSARIVFGGHNVPMDLQKAAFELPFADYLILGEGERPFEDLLLCFLGRKEEGELVNIAIRREDGTLACREDPAYVADRFASPYQLGLFDGIVSRYRSRYRFSATLESNRGCPFQCGYCDWGLNRVRVRFAPEEQIRQDIVWISEKGIDECYGADSNFGMFDRDLSFAKLLASRKDQTGYPKTFFVSFSKTSDLRVLEIASVLHASSMLQGATLSFQSLNPETLSAIGRRNLDLDYFARMMREYHLRRIPTYSELILGLPRETKESFQSGIAQLMECGQHSAIDVYECCLLPNSNLGQRDSIERYGITARRLPFRRFDIREREEIQEYANIVVSTNSMSMGDWRDCNLFYQVVSALHFGKLFHCVALYLHARHRVSYDALYAGILAEWRAMRGTVWGELVLRVSNKLDRIAENGEGWLFSWPDEGLRDVSLRTAFTKIVLRHYDDFMGQIERVLNRYARDEALSAQIARFQALCIKTKAERGAIMRQSFQYDFVPFFDALYLGERAVLEKQTTTVTGDDIRRSIAFGAATH